jgi:hypothetical protein
MDIVIVIPEELEPVIPYYEKMLGMTLSEKLAEWAVMNLEPLVRSAYFEEVTVKNVTMDEKVKAVDWTAKTDETDS